MPTLANEKYFGYNALISYLKSKKDKSYYGFLSRYREIVAVSTLSVPMPHWQNLNDTWISRFYISGLREIIRSEHEAVNFKILDGDNYQNSENEIHTNSGTISDLDFGTSNSHYDKERMSTLTRDDINELGIKNLSISKAKKSITTSTQKDNAHNVNKDTILELGIGTSSTSQADESINTSTQDDDSHNACNNTRINLAIETSRIQDDASNDELGIETSNTSQGEPRVHTLILDDNYQSSNNASIDAMVELGIGTSSTSQRNNNHASNQLDTGRQQYCLHTQERVDYKEGTPMRKCRRNSSVSKIKLLII
ncbi:hypothetical protein F8M41_011836 [Gigaspora margarita]|uniref:Uncharacterized protein n=1 Tax=Gigaspora margarita TaxID=4874 RepID=A0A8H4EPZ9_GIGMA|nr:hypothetical protein F8M41_011836 [Gigaspora margarita]